MSPAPASALSVRDGIRARLVNGALRPSAGLAWMGPAEGDHVCVGCGLTIGAVHTEYEIKDRSAIFAHVECFTIWSSESQILLAKRTGRALPAGAFEMR